MYKYLQVFLVSIKQEFAYKLSFIMWRVRNVIQVLIAYFLWSSIFSDSGRTLFGYDEASIITYVFSLIIVRAFVLSARAVDVAGEVSRGDLSNYLVKPVNYFRYWLTRDISSKALNLSFALVEMGILYLILKPSLYFQTNPLLILAFFISLFSAMFIYFTLLFIASAVPFWQPQQAWGAHFILIIIVDFLSGGLFPLDVLPSYITKVLSLTPFPYLIFYPIQVYLGKVSMLEIVRGFTITAFWMFVLVFIMNTVWRKGLKVYQAYGK